MRKQFKIRNQRKVAPRYVPISVPEARALAWHCLTSADVPATVPNTEWLGARVVCSNSFVRWDGLMLGVCTEEK